MVEKFELRLVDQVRVGNFTLRMLRGADPLADGPGKSLGRHAGVSLGHHLRYRLFRLLAQALQVAGQQRLVRLLLLPVGMIRCPTAEVVQSEEELEGQRFLRPQGAVVIEDRDALTGREEVLRSLVGHPRNEVQDLLPGTSFPPGGQGLPSSHWQLGQEQEEAGGEARCTGRPQAAEPAFALHPAASHFISSRPCPRPCPRAWSWSWAWSWGAARRMQRKPIWVVALSSGCGCRAAGR